MVPTPITDEMAAAMPGARLVDFTAPAGHEESTGTAGALVQDDGVTYDHQIHIPLLPNESEIERLKNGEPLWLVVAGVGLSPFAIHVGPAPVSI